MKKLAITLFFSGLLLTIGAAGGADRTPFFVTVLCMTSGIALLLVSERVYVRKFRIHSPKKIRRPKAQNVPTPQKSTVQTIVSPAPGLQAVKSYKKDRRLSFE